MNVVICAIAKNENKYINDWINWHLNKGFHHIYLFDNNDSSSEYVGNFIENIDKVTIYPKNDVRMDNLQSKCYNEFYRQCKNSFDWCLFCDIDEYIVGTDDINQFLDSALFDEFCQIRVSWKTFSDNDLIERDESIPVYYAFTELSSNEKLSNQSKSFVRGGLSNIWVSVHRAVSNNNRPLQLTQCTPSGIECSGNECINNLSNSEPIYLNHYRTKSLKEFINQKLSRGDACLKDRKIDFDYYWISNDRTEEKEKFINNFLNNK